MRGAIARAAIGLAIVSDAPASDARFGAPRTDVRGLSPTGVSATGAQHYARLDRDACEAELMRRDIPFERAEGARGVLALPPGGPRDGSPPATAEGEVSSTSFMRSMVRGTSTARR